MQTDVHNFQNVWKNVCLNEMLHFCERDIPKDKSRFCNPYLVVSGSE